MTTTLNYGFTSGHNCPHCGSYVPNGVTHVCHPAPPIDFMAQIAAALNRIATALEAIEQRDRERSAVVDSFYQKSRECQPS